MRKTKQLSNYWVWYEMEDGTRYYTSVKAGAKQEAEKMHLAKHPNKDVIYTWNVTTFRHDC